MGQDNQQKRRLLLQGLAAGALAGGAPLVRAAQEKVLRIGYQKFNTLNILKGTGRLEQALAPRGWQVKWFEFAAGPQLTEALNAQAIDFGHAADTPSVFANAAGVNAVYLGAEQPYPKGIAIFVAQDSPLRGVKDLKGKKVATGRGWNVQFLLLKALEEVGLGYQDIEPVYVTNAADVRAAFQSGNVDAATLWDPFLAGQELSTRPRVLRDGTGLSNNRTFHLAVPGFVDRNRDVVRTLFAELRQANNWTQGHPQETAELLAPQLGVDPKVLRLATERRNYTTVAVDAGIVAEQQQIADAFLKLGLIKNAVQVQDKVYRDVLL
ncbi:aliphatic sulfonate ABC transporter substrate-binding protein [Herbaspirillum sp. YR522]|uniref:aliphatic sulfonate ABC transporter substrate-binding protein n=1 Tax=Herbaspirillum sp. YR522 TaxID=1144342 RepID=UPI00026F7678|nr:aliphatic sulfonate ABC transporter substrate-binding protein [Herbaspirillum sp. YR522]EJN08151.1 ABC transporter, substrate-binding protein, aliphatic sulfonates family [Herbaspirillum sp. YR522]